MNLTLNISIIILSILCNIFFGPIISSELVTALLTIFSIFFGFYVTSLSVFGTSKYLSKLYRIENERDNRRTLLDDLLSIFSRSTYFLLASIIYLIIVQIILDNSCDNTYLYHFFDIIRGIIIINCCLSFNTINVFIKIIRQSAKQE